MQATEATGLRDRKRRATRLRIERAAVDIVNESGLEALTIDAISERAEVSPRTFFNYFDSKEDAIVGVRLTEDTLGTLRAAVDGVTAHDLCEGVLDVLAQALDDSLGDASLRVARKAAVRRHPELLKRQLSKMGGLREGMTRGIRDLMDRTAADGTPAATDAQAEIVLMSCGAALHAALVELAGCAEGFPDTAEAAAVRTRAAELLTETMKRMQQA